MSFTINPDFGNILAQFNMIEVQGLNYIWGAILAFIIILIVSTEGYHMRVMLLPTTIILHMFGIYQHILLFLIAVAMFATAAVSFKVLKGGITAIASGVQKGFQIAGTGMSAIKYGGLKNALMIDRARKEIDEAKYKLWKDDHSAPEVARLSESEKLKYLTPTEQRIFATMSPLQQEHIKSKASEVDKAKPFLEFMKKQEEILTGKKDIARETGKSMALSRKHQKQMASEFFVNQAKMTRRSSRYIDHDTLMTERRSLISKLKTGFFKTSDGKQRASQRLDEIDSQLGFDTY